MSCSKYKLTLSILCLSFIALVCSCTHDHSHDHNHENHPNDSTNHGQDKIVHLNQAQYLNAEIDTGWFEMKNINDVINANGYTKLDPQNRADVSLVVDGSVRSIKVIEGDYVKKGQTLATMTSLDYNEILLEKARLSERLEAMRINIDYLKVEYGRQEKLAVENISAKKVFEKVESDLKSERTMIKSMEEQMDIINQTIGLIDHQGAALIGVRAPISGFITNVNVNIGTVVSAGNRMFSIVDNSQIHLDLLVYEKDLGKVKIGQNVRFKLTNQSDKEILAEIYNIGKSFANDTKSVAVHADIEKNEENLIPGMYVNALIDIGNQKIQALPTDAIVTAEGRSFIFVWEKENMDRDETEEKMSFSRVEVKTGASQLDYVQITLLGEIEDGDKVVKHGAYYLQSHLQKSEGGGGHHH